MFMLHSVLLTACSIQNVHCMKTAESECIAFRLQSAQTAESFDFQTAVYLVVQTAGWSLLVQVTQQSV